MMTENYVSPSVVLWHRLISATGPGVRCPLEISPCVFIKLCSVQCWPKVLHPLIASPVFLCKLYQNTTPNATKFIYWCFTRRMFRIFNYSLFLNLDFRVGNMTTIFLQVSENM
ncbi:hypothetical protein LDENG_00225830 [Lucifuga dentata]|nr:hypothetical protein LDENG_00225830 [Lucifuga dentata]